MTRKSDTAATKESIIESSIKLFLAKGFVGTSVTELTNAAGIAKGTLYCHFTSKDEILDSILDKFSREFLDGAMAKVSECGGDFLTKFKVYYKYVTEFGRDHRELMLVWHTLLGEIIGNCSDTERKMKEFQGKYNAFLETFLEEGKKEGAIGDKIDTRIASRIITATLTGMLLQWYIESPSQNENRIYVRSFREAILKALGVSGPEVPAGEPVRQDPKGTRGQN